MRRSASGQTTFPNDIDLILGPIGEEPKSKKLVKQSTPSTMRISRTMNKEYAAYTDPTLEMSVVMDKNNHMVGLVRKDGKDCILIDEFVDCVDEDFRPLEMSQNEIDPELLIQNEQQRPRRQSNTPKTFFAEVCAFTDYSWFRRFERLAEITGSSSPFEDVQMFLTALFNEVNLFYTTLGQGKYRLIIVLQDYIIAQSDSESPWSMPDVNGTLEAFFAFIGHLDYIPSNFDLDKCDHFISFTAFGAFNDQQYLDPECRGGTWVMTIFLGLTNVTTWNTFSDCSTFSIGEWLRGGGTCFSKNSFEVNQVNEDRCLGFTGQMLTVEEQCIRLGGNGTLLVPTENIDCFNIILCLGDDTAIFPMIPPDSTMCAPEGSNTTLVCGASLEVLIRVIW